MPTHRVLLAISAFIVAIGLSGCARTTALHTAVEGHDMERVSSLSQRPFTLSRYNKEGFTPLCIAADNGNTPAVRQLLKAGADPDRATIAKTTRVTSTKRINHRAGRTPLYFAARGGNSDIVRLLLEAGADPNPAQFGPLAAAVGNGDVQSVQLLLALGADVHAENQYSETPLARARTLEMAEILFAAGAGDRALHKNAQTHLNAALVQTAGFAKLPLVARLLELGADPTFKSLQSTSHTALHNAGFAGSMTYENGRIKDTKNFDADRVQMLLDAGADPNTKDRLQQTPLHRARVRPNHHSGSVIHLERAALLLAAGADPNVRDWRGSTPLHYAASSPLYDEDYGLMAIQLLLEAGADPSLIANNGKSAADIALETGGHRSQLVASLQMAGSPLTQRRSTASNQRQPSSGSSSSGRALAAISAGALLTAATASRGVAPDQAARLGSAMAEDIYRAEGPSQLEAFRDNAGSPGLGRTFGSAGTSPAVTAPGDDADPFAEVGGECARKSQLYTTLGQRVSSLGSQDMCDIYKANYLVHAWGYDLTKICHDAGAPGITAEAVTTMRGDMQRVSQQTQTAYSGFNCSSYNPVLTDAEQKWGSVTY